MPHRDDPRWRRAQQAAKVALLWAMGAPLIDYSNGSTHYAAHYVRNDWTRRMELAAVVGRHSFYR